MLTLAVLLALGLVALLFVMERWERWTLHSSGGDAGVPGKPPQRRRPTRVRGGDPRTVTRV